MDVINLLKEYPVSVNSINFGIRDAAVEKELFEAVWIQRKEPTYNYEAVFVLSEMWKVPINYLVGRLRCEAAHKLLLIEKNMEEALYYYKLAASENQSVEALFSLSNLKLNIIQNLQAYEESLVHLKQAANYPHKIKYDDQVSITNKYIIESQLMYANLLFEGLSGKKDLNEAKKYYDLACEGSLKKSAPFAKYAIILCRGDGGDIIPKDTEKGLTIFREIIEDSGIENTQPGILYLYGTFLFEINKNEGIQFIRVAAKFGYPTAKENILEFEKKLNDNNNNNNNNNTENDNNNSNSNNNKNNNNNNNNNNKKKNSKQTKKNNLC
ncbi:hypothetical protein DDB_G0288443 [Dictyostelium discoideum AX4]|uniref:Uncharacterized protein n=1 Tax=Dictyostelium discoideum TaxID=44689 RepID=Q54IX4_DICDI|nr:hypothetical protein DDB_G0288443 [Dictyostelium discoideum AX4]EAL63247.1 hypothetical protein DDB_G0288443 [Dictyostelium discoideum AX4]|eukprot:XP_636756.1 hypothetical protein DDB_G0288443 [Dictyostelium discoideum AX4]